MPCVEIACLPPTLDARRTALTPTWCLCPADGPRGGRLSAGRCGGRRDVERRDAERDRRRCGDPSCDGRQHAVAILRTRLHQPALLAARPDHGGERRPAAPRVGLPHRRRTRERDEPDRRGRHDVPHGRRSTTSSRSTPRPARSGGSTCIRYRTTTDCCGPINRGVAVYGGRVFMGTVDARLVALDARDGRVLWDVQVGDNLKGYHITSAPVAVAGKVITGISCGEQGGRCYVTAYDAATGALVWRFYTIPSPAEGGWWGTWRDDGRLRDVVSPRHRAGEARHRRPIRTAGSTAAARCGTRPPSTRRSASCSSTSATPAPDVDGARAARRQPVLRLHRRPRPRDRESCAGTSRRCSHDLWDYDPAAPVVLADVREPTGRVVPGGRAGREDRLGVRRRPPDGRADPPLGGVRAAAGDVHGRPRDAGVLHRAGDARRLRLVAARPTARDRATCTSTATTSRSCTRRNHEELEPPAQYWGGVVTRALRPGSTAPSRAIDLRTGRIAWQDRLSAADDRRASWPPRADVVFTGLTRQPLRGLRRAHGRRAVELPRARRRQRTTDHVHDRRATVRRRRRGRQPPAQLRARRRGARLRARSATASPRPHPPRGRTP